MISIFLIIVSDDWFSRNRVDHPTMQKNHGVAQSGLTRRVLYSLDKGMLTRSSMCIEDNEKKLLVCFINI